MTFNETYAKAGAIIDEINDLLYDINSSKYGVTDLELALDMRSDCYEGDGECPEPTSEELAELSAECGKNAESASKVERLKQDYFDLTGVYPHYNGQFDWYERNHHEKYDISD